MLFIEKSKQGRYERTGKGTTASLGFERGGFQIPFSWLRVDPPFAKRLHRNSRLGSTDTLSAEDLGRDEGCPGHIR